MRKMLACSTVLSLSACSNFQSHPFALPPPGKDAKLQGLPFTLNRPVPQVQRTPGVNGQPDSYAIIMAYAPDPSASYDVKLTPGFLSQTDFKLDYDANGSLTGVTAKFDNQTATIITSAAKFAVAALPFLDQTSIDEKAAAIDINNAVRAAMAADPVLVYDEHGVAHTATPAELREMKQAQPGLTQRLDGMASMGEVADAFTINSWGEEKLMRGALHQLRFPPAFDTCAPGTAPKPLAVGGPPAGPPPPAQLPPAGRAGGPAAQHASPGTICDLPSGDQTKFASMYDARDLDGLNDAKQKSQTDIDTKCDGAAIIPPDSGPGALFDPQGRLNAATLYIGKLQGLAAAKLIFTILGRDSKSWQKLTVAQLDREIDTRRFEIRASVMQGIAIDESTDRRLLALVRQRAAVLGVASIYDRRQRLEHMVVTETGKGDFKAVFDEITYLDKRLADAEPAKGDPAAAKADAAAPAAFFQSEGETVDSAWIVNKLGMDWNRPKYVVVFDPNPALLAGSATQGFAPAAVAPSPVVDTSTSAATTSTVSGDTAKPAQSGTGAKQ